MSHIPRLEFSHAGWCPELGRSYFAGYYQPKTADEFHALKGYAENPPDWNGTDDQERDALVDKARAVGLRDEEGKKLAKTTLQRWDKDRLRAAIAAQEGK